MVNLSVPGRVTRTPAADQGKSEGREDGCSIKSTKSVQPANLRVWTKLRPTEPGT
jgi:hypothetical protein